MKRRSTKLSRASTRSAARHLIREMPSLLKLLFRLMKDGRVPLKDKALFALVSAYVISPIDLIPDFGFIGMVDDLYLVGLSLGRLLASAGEDILLEHWDGDPRTLGFFIETVESFGGLLPKSIRNALGTTAVTGHPPMKRRSRSGMMEEEEPKVYRARRATLKKRPRPESRRSRVPRDAELDEDDDDA